MVEDKYEHAFYPDVEAETKKHNDEYINGFNDGKEWLYHKLVQALDATVTDVTAKNVLDALSK